MSDSVATTSMRNQRLKLLAIMGLFAVPVIVASLWHANSDSWRPTDTSNYGELIVPARPLAAFSMPSLDGDVINETFLTGRWTLVYIGSAACATPCQTSLYNIRQLRLALNEKMDRVQRLWLLSDASASQPLAPLLKEHPGLKVAQPDAATLASLLAQFKHDDASVPVTETLYLVDPQGNLMMRYPMTAEPEGILKDIRRLLKTSWVG